MPIAAEADAPWRRLSEGLAGGTPAPFVRGPWSLPPDNLLIGWWTVVYGPSKTAESTTELIRHIGELLAERGEDAAAGMHMLWGTTAAGIQFNITAAPADVLAAPADPTADREQPDHARVARELKELTGLSAEVLGSGVGVTREQFQRWLKGSPISDARHGQLIYLHTIAADVARRLATLDAKIWWKTPGGDGLTPAELLRRRQANHVYRLVSALPDSAPVVDGVLVTLPQQEDADLGSESNEDGKAWSPYGDTSG